MRHLSIAAGLITTGAIALTVKLLTAPDQIAAHARTATGPVRPGALPGERRTEEKMAGPAASARALERGNAVRFSPVARETGDVAPPAAVRGDEHTGPHDTPNEPGKFNSRPAPAGHTTAAKSGFKPGIRPVLPVAFQEVPAAAVVLTPEQAASAERVQDQFIDDMGGEAADAAAPEYARKWPSAQSLADQRLRAAIGAQAFMRWQEKAHLDAKKKQAEATHQKE